MYPYPSRPQSNEKQSLPDPNCGASPESSGSFWRWVHMSQSCSLVLAGWLRGWICVIAILTMYGFSIVLVQLKNPGLLAARATWRHQYIRPFDRVFIAFCLPLYFALPIAAGLDAVRFRWSSLPFATVYVGLALLALGIMLVAWAKLVNPFAESTVRIQTERHHTTVTAGPYRIVRPPIYVGAILMFPATGLIVGSLWALVIGLLLAVLFVWRTAMEDRTLRRELTGYEALVAVTRYRLLPGVW